MALSGTERSTSSSPATRATGRTRFKGLRTLLRGRTISLKIWLLLLIILSVLLPVQIMIQSEQLLEAYNDRYFPVVPAQPGEVVPEEDVAFVVWDGNPVTGMFELHKRQVNGNSWKYRLVNRYAHIPMYALSLLSVLAIIWLFYRWKLHKPLSLLNEGMAHIRQQDLDFKVDYHSRDELGQLCQGFEQMRGQLNDTFHELWDAQAAQVQLVQAFAHDLRTPLTVLKGFAGLLELQADRDTLEPAKVKQHALLMQDNIIRIERYLDGLRELRSLEQWKLSVSPLSLSAYADRLRSEASLLARLAGKQLTVEPPAETTVHWDAALVSRILTNLTANALHYAASQVRITLRREQAELVITLSDDGPGLDAAALQRAFEPFYRGDDSRSGAGLGLGLSIARSLAVRHGGSLGLANRLADGRVAGAEAMLRLPCAADGIANVASIQKL